LPGMSLNTTPTDYRINKQLQMMRFDGERWVLFGPASLLTRETRPTDRPRPLSTLKNSSAKAMLSLHVHGRCLRFCDPFDPRSMAIWSWARLGLRAPEGEGRQALAVIATTRIADQIQERQLFQHDFSRGYELRAAVASPRRRVGP